MCECVCVCVCVCVCGKHVALTVKDACVSGCLLVWSSPFDGVCVCVCVCVCSRM